MSNSHTDMSTDYADQQSHDDRMEHLEGQWYFAYLDYCNDAELDPEDYPFSQWADEQLPEFA